MSLSSRVVSLAQRIGGEIKTLKTTVNSHGSAISTLQAQVGSGGGGGAVIKTTVIDCGVRSLTNYKATITDAAITATSKVLVAQSGAAATGRNADEAEMEVFVASATPAAGSMTVYLHAVHGCRLQGNVRINYQVG